MPFDAATIGTLFGKFKQGATAAGTAVAGAAEKMTAGASGLDIANAGLGLLGGMNFMNAKKPTIDRPETFSSVVPVQNYEADRQAGLNQIAQNASSAMGNIRSNLGGDWASYASAALGVNAQGNQAANQLSQGIGQQKRQDNIQAAQQMNADREFNYTTQRSFDEAQYNQQMDAYKGQRVQGAGMMQGALNYIVGKDASNRDFEQRQILSQQQKDATMIEHVLRGNDQDAKQNVYKNFGMSYMAKPAAVATQPNPVTPQAPAATPAANAAPAFSVDNSLFSRKPGTKNPLLNSFSFQPQ